MARGQWRKRSCILLWMNGGPSHSWIRSILSPATKRRTCSRRSPPDVPGIRISEHLPQVAQQMIRLAIVRSMTSKEADHGRASYLVRTRTIAGSIAAIPDSGLALSKELGARLGSPAELREHCSLSIDEPGAYNSGFLGPRYALSSSATLRPRWPNDRMRTAI